MKFRLLMAYLAPLSLAPLTSQLSLPLNTTLPFPLSTPNDIICASPSAPGSRPTTVTGCRPTLNYLRTLPAYRRIQDFQEDWGPKVPTEGGIETPPFTWHNLRSDCAVHVASGDVAIIDHFSFEQVRSLATDILEECREGGGKGWGLGGGAPIGRGVGWIVVVSGFAMEGVGGSGSVKFGLVEGGGNG